MGKGIPEFTIYRVMKENLHNDARITREVKQEIAALINQIIKNICMEFSNKHVDITYKDFQEAAKVYLNITDNYSKSKQKKEKTINYLSKVISDCETIKNDLEEEV